MRPATRTMESTDMKDENSRKKPKRTDGNASEIGVIRVFSNPGPDAEDRLRRLTSLLIKYATRDGEDGLEKDSLEDARPADDPTEAEE